jgi:hypothetical protein
MSAAIKIKDDAKGFEGDSRRYLKQAHRVADKPGAFENGAWVKKEEAGQFASTEAAQKVIDEAPGPELLGISKSQLESVPL